MQTINETAINVISEGTSLEGKVTFDDVSRVHGAIQGEVFAKPGSTLVLCESSLIEGNIQADTLFIDGFVRGNIEASTRVVISGTGRVVGNITTPSLNIEFGAYFEGRSVMPSGSESSSGARSSKGRAASATSSPALKPA